MVYEKGWVFIFPQALAGGYKTQNEFRKTSYKIKGISESFYQKIYSKNIKISWLKCVNPARKLL